METTYRDLINPVPPRLNLSNIQNHPASPPCAICHKLLPDRQPVKNNIIKTDYELVDTFPDFPGLRVSAKLGCELCRFLRKTIRTTWAVRPMEEWGVGALSEKEGLWNELFETPWDGIVKIQNARFTFTPFPGSNAGDNSLNSPQLDGVLTRLTLDFGPASTPKGKDDEELHGDISQMLSFKAYSSIGTRTFFMIVSVMVADQELGLLKTCPPQSQITSGGYLALTRSLMQMLR